MRFFTRCRFALPIVVFALAFTAPAFARRRAPSAPPVEQHPIQTLALFPFTGKGATATRKQAFDRLASIPWIRLVPLGVADEAIRATPPSAAPSATEALQRTGASFRVDGRIFTGSRSRLFLVISDVDGKLVATFGFTLRRGSLVASPKELAARLDPVLHAPPPQPAQPPTPITPPAPISPAPAPQPEPSPAVPGSAPPEAAPVAVTPAPTTTPLPEPKPATPPTPEVTPPRPAQVSSHPVARPAPAEPPGVEAVSTASGFAPGATKNPLVELAVGAGAMRRTLTYTDDLFHVLAGYRANAVLSADFQLALFPFARLEAPVVRGLAILGSGQAEPRIDSVDTSGRQYGTSSSRWRAGVGYRLALGDSEVGLFGFYGNQSFSLTSPGSTLSAPIAGPIPAVSYTFVAPQLSGRIGVGDHFFVLASATYLDVMDTGEIGSATRFPRLKVGAVEGQLGLGVRISGPWELRVTGDYRRYYFSFNPQPGDPYIAGGAVDEYITLLGGVAARWP